MKKITNILLLSMLTLTIGVITAQAQMQSERVTFSRDFLVNNTSIKKGTYKVLFDPSSSELMILDGKNELIKTKVRLVDRAIKPERVETVFAHKSEDYVLMGITFAGENKTMIVDNGDIHVALPQQ
ncbi:MAG: hypothetical protein AB1489_18715 [Acidobacteriota bacterium]